MRRLVTTLVVTLSVIGLAAACDDNQRFGHRDCDYTRDRCRTVCDYWCDGWGCYPVCWDDCWGECYQNPNPPVTATSDGGSTPVNDASVVVDAGIITAPPPPSTGGDGGGALCAPCAANDECSNNVCILRGGVRSDGGVSSPTGFCGQTCTLETDCPDGFACSALGASSQCLPKTGFCVE